MSLPHSSGRRNVLLTCAGRRNYLVAYFRDALAGDGAVFAADASPAAPALAAADTALIVPRINAPHYIDHLLDLCQTHAIAVLVSLNDLELPVLAAARERFLAAGTIPVVSSPAVIATCFDKFATLGFLQQCNLPVPHTYLSLPEARRALAEGRVQFPLVVKPRWGTASIGIDIVQSDEELELSYRLAYYRLERSMLAEVSATAPEQAVLIQEKLAGDEYGLDVVNDLHGQYVTTLARRKVAMRGGETDRAVTVASPLLADLGATIGRTLQHVGNLDCDVFVHEERGVVLELNPRFGGGYPFSHSAGANIPAAVVAWACGRAPAPEWLTLTPGVAAAKYDNVIVTGRDG